MIFLFNKYFYFIIKLFIIKSIILYIVCLIKDINVYEYLGYSGKYNEILLIWIDIIK